MASEFPFRRKGKLSAVRIAAQRMKDDSEWEGRAENDDADLIAFVAHFFSDQGPLAAAKNFEYRPQQQEMAVAVAQTLESGEHLIVEAGTGVGKSLAYLVPSIFFALLREKKAVISTQTINLQQQLTQKDLPDLQRLLQREVLQKILKEPFQNWLEVLKEKKPFQFAMLKGRANYLCTGRLRRALERAESLFTDPERQELQRIKKWVEKITQDQHDSPNQDGSLDNLKDYLGREPNPETWAQICSEQGACSFKLCGKDSDFGKGGNPPMCFFQRARNKYHSADLVVLNHSLFFSLFSADETGRERRDDSKGVLFPNDFVVFDEAHSLEKIASQHIGIDLRRLQVRYALNRLWNPKTKKGQMTVLPRSAGAEKIIKQVEQLYEDAENFFDELEKAGDKLASSLKPNPQRKDDNLSLWKTIRVRHPNLLNDSLYGPLKDLREQLVGFIQQTKDKETNQELGASNDRLADIQSNLSRWIGQEKEDYVYWIERAGKSQKNISLCASPIHIAEWCRKELLDRDTSLILTSATLAVAESSDSTNQAFHHFASKIGGEDMDTKQVGSPFDYPNQMRVYVAGKMPSPKEKDFEDALVPWILWSIKKSHGKALVLFTSYRLMNTAYNAVLQSFEKEESDRRILLQGDGVSNPQLLEQFKQDTNSVLFGTASFWQGVDVPGEALSNVTITKLPFEVPDHPLEEARVESIEARGGNPFLEHSLPEAILKFRQGVGRLIRTESDQGIIMVLDSRIVQKRYGQNFLESIPQCPVTIV